MYAILYIRFLQNVKITWYDGNELNVVEKGVKHFEESKIKARYKLKIQYKHIQKYDIQNIFEDFNKGKKYQVILNFSFSKFVSFQ